jgi:hypothetical protein
MVAVMAITACTDDINRTATNINRRATEIPENIDDALTCSVGGSNFIELTVFAMENDREKFEASSKRTPEEAAAMLDWLERASDKAQDVVDVYFGATADGLQRKEDAIAVKNYQIMGPMASSFILQQQGEERQSKALMEDWVDTVIPTCALFEKMSRWR